LSEDLKKIWVVEINPPPPTAGASLFNWWKSEDDRKIIMGLKNEELEHKEEPGEGEGEKELVSKTFEFRVLSELNEGGKASLNKIHPPLKRFINRLRNRNVSKVEGDFQGLTHLNTACDGCRMAPITEIWWRCGECENYDLCEGCYTSRKADHDMTHLFHRVQSIDLSQPAPTVQPPVVETKTQTQSKSCTVQ